MRKHEKKMELVSQTQYCTLLIKEIKSSRLSLVK